MFSSGMDLNLDYIEKKNAIAKCALIDRTWNSFYESSSFAIFVITHFVRRYSANGAHGFLPSFSWWNCASTSLYQS